ncbi:carboxylating nicotinate-nucleotide diphosphorylase [Desulfovibrio sp. OttesenSCG-928-O18]|nr:carboxylating nicotinate-nucleotide diphosphorylase [Desulfovibrio sp. OttesenSCG-928-O18]
MPTDPTDPADTFEAFFNDDDARRYLYDAIAMALREDGPDLTSSAVFAPEEILAAEIVAKDDIVLAGLPLIPIILQEALSEKESAACTCEIFARDGQKVRTGTVLATLRGGARRMLKAERIILNFLCHLSGVATLTAKYVEALAGTGITLLDTRKTLPGLRYPEKYAVLMGGAKNHRKNLAEVLMLKDNHIDMAGSITKAVEKLREAYSPCPPIEVECRNEAEVREAVARNVDWIMFDNMTPREIADVLALVPKHIKTEVSGGVSLDNITDLATAGKAGLTYISVGRLTHSAPYADCSMRIRKDEA